MNFQYSEEQQLLADSMARLAEQHYGFDARKHIIASEQGWCPETWSRLAELGAIGFVKGIHAELDSLEKKNPLYRPFCTELRTLVEEHFEALQHRHQLRNSEEVWNRRQ